MTCLLSIRMRPLTIPAMRIAGKPRDTARILRGCGGLAIISHGLLSVAFASLSRSTVAAPLVRARPLVWSARSEFGYSHAAPAAADLLVAVRKRRGRQRARRIVPALHRSRLLTRSPHRWLRVSIMMARSVHASREGCIIQKVATMWRSFTFFEARSINFVIVVYSE